MKDPILEGERARAVIRSACRMLVENRTCAPVFVHTLNGWDEDLAVLLRDATQVFCRAVSALHGEPFDHRWSPELADRLLACPEKCDETLARVEESGFTEACEVQYASV